MVEPLGRRGGCSEPSRTRSGAHRPAARAYPRSGPCASAHADAAARSRSGPRTATHPGAPARRGVAGARACTAARSSPASAQRRRLGASARTEAHPRPYAARTAPQRAASAVPCSAASGAFARTHTGPRAELRAASARGGARGLAVGPARGGRLCRDRGHCRLPPLAWVTGQSGFRAIRASIAAHPASTSGPIKRRAISASSADTASAASRYATTPHGP